MEDDNRSLSLEKRIDDLEKIVQNKTEENDRNKRLIGEQISKDISDDDPQIVTPKILSWSEMMKYAVINISILRLLRQDNL